ncbi:MAG: cell division protein FtsQ [Odoribacteraceae bacterium]|nr:cell division protein FtsQ [Odoribacteraceae bacterium]
MLAYSIIILTFAAAKLREVKCRGVRVTVTDAALNAFVDEVDVLEMIKKGYGTVVGKQMMAVNKDSLERLLAASPMIETVQVYYGLDGYFRVKIKQREPVLRVMAGDGYYVDKRGGAMPLSSKFTSRVIVATGNIDKTFAREQLAPFVKRVAENAFWNAFIEQVVVLPNNDVVLIPKVGDFKITLGALENYQGRMQKLMIFLKRGAARGGWNTYKEINLKFDKQVICTRR